MGWREKSEPMVLKDFVKRMRSSGHFAPRILYLLLSPLLLVWRFATDRVYRNSVVTKLRFGQRYFQQSSFTKADRYPVLFAAVRDYLKKLPEPRILSFGCSTGEEVETISNYIPKAVITGVDINESCIRQCRKTYVNRNFTFWHSLSGNYRESGNYDAIFCMAVFQHTDNRRVLKNSHAVSFTFYQFESEIVKLDEKLKEGGLLIIDHSDFSFEDASVYPKYRPLEFPYNRINRNRPIFNRDNVLSGATQSSYRVFVKCKS